MKQNKLISIAILFSIIQSGCLNQKLSVEEAWAHPGAEGDNSAVYLIIDNPLQQPDILSSAVTDIAEDVEIHKSMMDDAEMMTMERQELVQVDSRTRILFQPGGLHIMLINLRRDLKLGDAFNLILNFEEAGNIEIEVLVREP